MKIIDWVAILGATAWLPYIILFLIKYLTKPEVRIITQKIAEIGFTTYGPIFNMRVAFSVKNHDLVLSNLKVKITHHSGEEKLFEWQGITQHVVKMYTSEGSIPYEKENAVLAIKLNQKEVEERSIQFREKSFIEGQKEIADIIIKKLSFAKEQDNYDPITFLKTQEAKEMYNYIKHAFSWKTGNYRVVYEIESPDKYNLVGNEYEFNLTPIDIEELEKNKEIVEQDYINMLVNKEHEEYKKIYWKWRNPSILPKT